MHRSTLPTLVGFALALTLTSHSSLAAPAGSSPDSLRATVVVLADDRLEGRGAGTAGLDRAADYLASRFAALGLQPAGEGGSFHQPFAATTGVRVAGDNALRLGDGDLALGTDWNPYGFSETGKTSAPVVFAGYGITAAEYGYDDYAGIDVRGKVVLVLRHEPARRDSTSAFAGRNDTPYADPRSKALMAREKGALGLLTVTGPLSDDDDQLVRPRPDAGYYSAGIPCAQIARAALAAAVPELDIAALQQEIDRRGQPLGRVVAAGTIDWSVGLEKQRAALRNVVGLLPGERPGRVLVLGAHYDHLGLGGEGSLEPDVRAPHNGADDNASGVAALVEIARRFAAGPRPATSVLFVAFSGEELGLAGSEHYVKHPFVPLDSTLAMINMDMVGRLRDRKLQVFGSDTAQEWSHLLEVLNSSGPRFTLKMSGDGYGPSDQMAFFKKGIPVLHFFTGVHADYHKPSDDAALLDYEGLAAVADLVYEVASAVLGERLTFVAATGPAPGAGDRTTARFRTTLGVIPDYAQDENLKGLLLSGVRKGGAGDQAGLQGGDLIVQVDSMQILNIYDYMHVLKTHEPGDRIEITVVRGGEKVVLHAVLAPPGGAADKPAATPPAPAPAPPH